jgi:hypothetical protein
MGMVLTIRKDAVSFLRDLVSAPDTAVNSSGRDMQSSRQYLIE